LGAKAWVQKLGAESMVLIDAIPRLAATIQNLGRFICLPLPAGLQVTGRPGRSTTSAGRRIHKARASIPSFRTRLDKAKPAPSAQAPDNRYHAHDRCSCESALTRQTGGRNQLKEL
jgi:hypothetical protein